MDDGQNCTLRANGARIGTQIAMKRGIALDIALPSSQPIAFGALTDAQFNALMEQSFEEYKQGKTIAAQDVEAEMHRKYGI